MVAGRALGHVYDLADYYKKRGRNDVGFLWSGNIAHELISLATPRSVTTALGEKLRQEAMKPIYERLTGD